MSDTQQRPRPRPSRERGRKRLDSMAYQRAAADLRQRHRDEFDELRRWHLERLTAETEVRP